MKKILTLFTLLIITSFSVFSQKDTLILLNGNTYALEKYTFNQEDSSITASIVLKKVKTKEKQFDINDVFGIKKQNGTLEIFYKPATNEYTPQQMQDFIKGEQLATKYYKPTIAIITEYLLSTAITLELSTMGYMVYSPVGVLIPTITLSLIPPSKNKFDKKFPKLKDKKYIKQGYIAGGKNKKTINLIESGLAGMLTGLVTVIILM